MPKKIAYKLLKFYLLALISACVLLPDFVAAEEERVDGGFELIHESHRGIKTQRWQGLGLDQVDAKQSQNLGDMNASEALRELPGVQVQSSGSIGSQSTVRLRGTTDDQNLIMLDDVPLNSPFDNAYDFADFTLEGIDAIHVTRGAQSGYYGTNAMGGVVNMQSASGKGPLSLESFFWGGSYTTLREGVAVQQGNERWAFHLQYSRSDMQEELGHDAYHNNTASLRVDYHPISPLRVTLSTRFYQAEKELPSDVAVTNLTPFTLSFVRDSNRQSDALFLFQSLRLDYALLRWYHPSLQLAWMSNDYNLDNPSDTSGSFNPNVEFSKIDFQRFFIRNNHNFLLYPGIELEVAYELNHELLDVDSAVTEPPVYANLINQDRTVHAGILQGRFYWREWFIKAGGRYDQSSDYEDVLSPQIQAGYHYTPLDTIIKASYSRGFRSPSFRELATPLIGNASLRPETSHAIDLGLEKQLPDQITQLRVAYFYNYFEDLITIGSLARYDNIAVARSQGLEAQGCLQLSSISNGCIAYTFTDSEIDNEDGSTNQIPLIPNHNLTVQFTANPTAKTTLRFAANYRGEQSIEAIPNVTFQSLDGTNLGTTTDPFIKVDADASYRLIETPQEWLKTLDLGVHGENLLNQEIEEFPGFPNPGITILAGVRAKFI